MGIENTAKPSNRLHYLDWLRVLAMFCVFLFHNSRFFDAFSDWHVKNNTTSIAASIMIGFMSQWLMPVFFLIAGAGTYFALRSKKIRQYFQDRTLRLFVPLVFGMLVIVVPQAYFEAISHGINLEGYNFFQIYLLYLQTLPDLNWFHLWFLAFLFVFSIVTLPIIIKVFPSGDSIISKINGLFRNPISLIIILVVLIAMVNIFIYPDGISGNRGSGGWNIICYLLFFISGYIFFSNRHFWESIKGYGIFTLITGLIGTTCLLTIFVEQVADPGSYFGSFKYAAAHIVQAINTVCWIITFLSFGSRFLNTSNKFVTYANEAVLPFYVLHQTIIIVIGYYVVQWNIGTSLKYIIIATTSFIGIMAIYEGLVRHFNIMRFLFGMKLKRRKSAA